MDPVLDERLAEFVISSHMHSHPNQVSRTQEVHAISCISSSPLHSYPKASQVSQIASRMVSCADGNCIELVKLGYEGLSSAGICTHGL